MKKWMVVALWEYLTKVRTKTFIASIILTPLFMGAMMVLPSYLAMHGSDEAQVIGVVDQTGMFTAPLDSILKVQVKLESGQPGLLIRPIKMDDGDTARAYKEGNALLKAGTIQGYLIIRPGIFKSGDVEFRAENTGNFKIFSSLESVLRSIVIRHKLISMGGNPELLKELQTNINLDIRKVSKEGKVEDGNPLIMFFTSFAFIMLMFFLIITSGQMLVRSTIEEKSNRIIEVIVSSAKPMDLMIGKIIGLSGLGLTQVGIWTLVGIVIALSAGVMMVTFSQLLLFAVYFFLGYLLYAALFVMVGSILTTEQEAQQWMGYVGMLLAVPLVFVMSSLQNPNMSTIRILEFIPFFTPLIMAMKIPAGTTAIWEYPATIAVLLLSVLFFMWAAGKIFKVGILIYGKRPTYEEILRWIKAS